MFRGKDGVKRGAWGAAALDPSMSELTRPVSRQQAERSPVRLTVLMLAALIAPAVLFIQSLRGRYHGESVIAVFSAILYLLVLSRLWEVAASHRRALGRERAVRLTGASLASAVTVQEAAATVRGAAVALLDPRSQDEALLVVRNGGELRAVVTTSGDSPRMNQLAELTETCLPLLTGSRPLFLSAATLGEHATVPLRGCDGILLCPVTLKDRPSGDPIIGVLAVFGAERTLAGLSATLEILAQQAALAVERVMLSQEVIRRGSEAYFRTLVQDTSDVILIIGDDGKVRYATPSATSIFGDIGVEGNYLGDLVKDSERDDVARALTRMREHAGGTSYYQDMRITRRDNVEVQVQVRCSDLRSDSTVGALVLTLRDVTAQRQLEDELKHRACHDALTGLPNRLLFAERAAGSLVRTRRGGTTAGVLFVDLDDFKVVNDTMGHSVGDELLVAAGYGCRPSYGIATWWRGWVATSLRCSSRTSRILLRWMRSLSASSRRSASPSFSPTGQWSPRPPSAWPPRRTVPTWTNCSVMRIWPCTRRRRPASGSGVATCPSSAPGWSGGARCRPPWKTR